ncbi:DNA (cytosine-5-)-methyltransferase [Chryseobacterium sp. NEB161]|nr:DNA (cytosine-5-)-methyltransferase [Chryseobacterium sp. NEB161]
MNNLNIIELFSGIGGFTKGFEDAGYTIGKHYFSEIDKHAIANYKYNFPDAEYIGSVVDIRPDNFRDIDIITFGSPCQDFSLAGKRKGLEGERSSLIQYAIDLISHIRPSVFIWENVKGAFSSNSGADFWAILQAFANIGGYRLEWQLLNTKWFLPQNRERIYLVGHLANRSEPGVFPITENDKVYNSGRQIEKETNGFASALMANHFQSQRGNFVEVKTLQGIDTLNTIRSGGRGSLTDKHSWDIIQVKSATSKGYEIANEGDSINLSNPNSETRRGRVGKGVAQTLDCSCNQAVIGAFRGRNPENPKSRESGLKTEQMLELNENGVANTLTSVQKDNVVVGTWRTHNDGKGFRKVTDNNSPTIPARAREDGSSQPVIKNESSIRRLTEIECERLQGFPDDWTKYGNYDRIIKEILKTQRYKMLGNAVTVKVVEEIAKRLKPKL